ncbi:Protein of unknown function [Rhodococcoides kroppenstedtii]|uniref:Portal protein n=1 Tax=Rhodococcoides kroppenstedtii TaxID=293050 RepID=A0A1I0U9X6_9NOCA|nr:hypothetical protein [Rhodococcus kroppenstedtii]SFA60845.1 Protein of unknown function [Rhodococcus kroppenstedtii]
MATTDPTKPSTAPEFESGYVNGSGNSWNWMVDEAETTPELQWPASIETYAKMCREDAQVTSMLRAVQLPIQRTIWRVRPNGARPEVYRHIAADLGLPVEGEPSDETPLARTRGRFSWTAHLQQAMEMFKYGHAFFEQVAQLDEETGLFHLRKLAARKQNTIERINVALDGGLESIVQRPPASMSIFKNEPIPVSRLVAYVFDQEPGVWTGRSLLRPAYKHWMLKDRLLRTHATMVERNGLGMPVYTGAEGATSDDLSKGRRMASEARAGRYAGAGLPYGATLKFQGVDGNLPDALPGIKYHDEQIGRAALTHFLNLGQQTGSWALGTEFANFFIMTLQTVAETIRDIANQHVVEDIVDWNWGPTEQAPLLVFDEIGSQHAPVAEALKTLVDAGILFPDRKLEEAVRERYSLPSKGTPAPSTDDTTASDSASTTRRPRARGIDPAQGSLFEGAPS